MEINIRQVLEFFDEEPEYGRGHTSGIVGIIGEDLNASVFKRFMEAKGVKAEILEDSVTTHKKKGQRLDRWIYVNENGLETLYQCEIKNWSSWAIGGRRLNVDASEDEIREVCKYYWSH
jgi:hypothetical protein